MNKEVVAPAADHFKVLIVDDDLTILGLLKEILSMVPGVVATPASKPDEAMKLLAAEDFDIVFTDIHMPGVTGIEMIQDIISLDKELEVIVMTAYPTGEIAQQAMELGASSLIGKPFDDISLVELELDKAIKKLLRQRLKAEKLAQKTQAKKNASSSESKPVATAQSVTELPAISLPDSAVPAAKAEKVPAPAESAEVSYHQNLENRKVYSHEILKPIIEIEIERCKRYKRQFTLGFVDFPENLQLKTKTEKLEFKEEQLARLHSCFRDSDVVIDAGKDGMAVIGFECNQPGAHVLQFKLGRAGFQNFGFSVFPTDADNYEGLYRKIREDLQEKRRYRIGLLESEEFFGRIVQNMLVDPKYNVSWMKDLTEANKYAEANSENLRLFILSLSKDPKQWEMLSNWKKNHISNWPIILFTDVILNAGLKEQLQKLGVKAIVRKGAGQEEFLYVVQSFIMQPSVSVIRKNPRALVTLPAVYRYEGKEVSSNTFTLSREGVFIRDLNPPPTGSEIEIELLIPKRKGPVKCVGEVIYSVPYFVGVSRIHVAGMAVKFKNLSPELLGSLDDFISTALTSYLIDPE